MRQKRYSVSFKDFRQFHQLVTGETNRHYLTQINQETRETLSLRFKTFFDHPLSPTQVWQVLPPSLGQPWVYGVDGKWLKRRGVFLIHRNITTKENLYWSFWPGETYVALYQDLERFAGLLGTHIPVGVVSDWKKAMVSAVAFYFPGVPHQRCLTHVVRQAKKRLPRKSPFEATLDLRAIAQKLSRVNTEPAKRDWLASLADWEKQYDHMLKERTIGVGTKKKWWYTHGDLRRGWRLLTHDWDPFFVHLYQPMVPSTNNSLEGVISQADNKLINHRGMRLIQQVSFLSWHLTFTKIKTKQDLRRLWDCWKESV